MRKKAKIGKHTKVWHFANLYGCTIGKSCIIGAYVEIQDGVVIGNKVKIGSHSFLPTGVTIEDEVYIGHHVVFTNDKYPRSLNPDGTLQKPGDWENLPTFVKRGASIGSNATILPGITIGEYAMVGAGSIVTKNVPPRAIVVGNPARIVRFFEPQQKARNQREAVLRAKQTAQKPKELP